MSCCLIVLLCLVLPLSAFGQASGASETPSSPAPAQTPTGQDAPVSPDSVTKSPAAASPYSPITPVERIEWFALQSVGPESLVVGIFSAGFGTWRDKPVEYGSTWEGFGKRYGMRLTGVATGNAMEAAAGAPLGEDPRYFTMRGQPMRKRIRNVVVMTFAARHRDGTLGPDYARYVAIPGSNFLSNTWRANSESTTGAALGRTALGFAGRMASNALQEFWPDVRDGIFHRRAPH